MLNLRWRDIGVDAINLADSKTGPRGRTSPRCPVRATRRRTCFRAMPKAGASGFSRTAGALSAPMQSSAGCGCMTSGIPPPVKP